MGKYKFMKGYEMKQKTEFEKSLSAGIKHLRERVRSISISNDFPGLLNQMDSLAEFACRLRDNLNKEIEKQKIQHARRVIETALKNDKAIESIRLEINGQIFYFDIERGMMEVPQDDIPF